MTQFDQKSSLIGRVRIKGSLFRPSLGMSHGSGECLDGICKLNCDPGYHLYYNPSGYNECEEDSTTNCGAHDNRCNIENATTTICSDGICKATECVDKKFDYNEDEGRYITYPAYHLYDDICEEDSNENCGSHGVSCSTDQFCTDGCCTPFRIDDIITFGQYEQDGDTQNGKEPIAWRVIGTNCSNQSTQILVLSEKVLGRKLSSSDIFDTAFTDEEKAMIVPSITDYDRESWVYDTNFFGKRDEYDEYKPLTEAEALALEDHAKDYLIAKVFILSRKEVCKYLTKKVHDNYVTDYSADATDYAITMGLPIISGKTNANQGLETQKCISEHCYARWWLRTSGDVDNTGLALHGHENQLCNENYKYYIEAFRYDSKDPGVRPAMWIQF